MKVTLRKCFNAILAFSLLIAVLLSAGAVRLAYAADEPLVLVPYVTAPTAADWTKGEEIPFTATGNPSATGTVSLRAVVTSATETYLYLHLVINDTSISKTDNFVVWVKNLQTERIAMSEGKIGDWFRDLCPTGGYSFVNSGWSAPGFIQTGEVGEAGSYEINWGIALESEGVKGARFSVVVGYNDSTAWGNLNETSTCDLSYRGTIEFGAMVQPHEPNEPAVQNVTAEILQSEPTVSSWGDETQYDMQKVFDDGKSSGKISFRAAVTGANSSFLYVRWIVSDPSVGVTDSYYVHVRNHENTGMAKSNGKIGEWIRILDPVGNYTFQGAKGEGAAGSTMTSVTTGEAGGPGTYEMIWKFGLGADVQIGNSVEILIAYKDTTGFEDLNENSTFTVRFDAVVTFVDHYVQPHDATDNFTLTVSDVTFESLVASWMTMTEAETYGLLFYRQITVPAAVSQSETLYDCELAFASLASGYEDIFFGLKEGNLYAVQAIGYDANHKIVCWSSVAYITVPAFETE